MLAFDGMVFVVAVVVVVLVVFVEVFVDDGGAQHFLEVMWLE